MLGRMDLETIEAELKRKGETLHSSKPHTLSAMITMPARGLLVASASPA
jgi:hypothetical protein